MSSLYPENSIVETAYDISVKSSAGYGKSPVFLFDSGEFKMIDGKVYMAEGEEALKSWIEKVVRTERYRFPIYSPDFGVTLEELSIMNLSYDVLIGELKQQITEALLQNPMVSSVDKFEFIREGSTLNIGFEVQTLENGNVEMEVGVNV